MFDQSAAPLPQTHIEDTPVTDRIETDICIIGAGAGGLSVAAGAAQMGARVVLLEGHKMGGDCLNYGCVPSKALIAAGKQAHAMGAGQSLGVAPVMAQVDYGAAKDHVAQAIATIAPHDSQERFEGFGIKVIREYGRFISKTEVQAGDTVITARRFVIATGSGPFVPPIPGLDTVPHYTNETVFDLRTQPTHLIIIGGGVISYSGLNLVFPFAYEPTVQGMQSLQLLHAVAALVMLALIIAHIYIGTLGMEGAFEAMWRGTVDENWARSHHSLWTAAQEEGIGGKATPSE